MFSDGFGHHRVPLLAQNVSNVAEGGQENLCIQLFGIVCTWRAPHTVLFSTRWGLPSGVDSRLGQPAGPKPVRLIPVGVAGEFFWGPELTKFKCPEEVFPQGALGHLSEPLLWGPYCTI